MSEGNKCSCVFHLAQLLGSPLVSAPPKEGSLSVTVQFLIPGFNLANKEKKAFVGLADRCGFDVYAMECRKVMENSTTKEDEPRRAVLASIAFYVAHVEGKDDEAQEVDKQSRLLVERYMGVLSFYAGMKLPVQDVQHTVIGADGQNRLRLDATRKAEIPRIEITLPEDPFGGKTPSDNIFSALFWLRRGLADKDVLEAYSSLMVCLQIVAREIVVDLGTEPRLCPSCKVELDQGKPGPTALARGLVVDKLGRPKEMFDRIWKVRNVVVAHGNETVTADTFLALTELKMDAATLCFDGIKLALGMNLERPPFLQDIFFISPSLMHLD